MTKIIERVPSLVHFLQEGEWIETPSWSGETQSRMIAKVFRIDRYIDEEFASNRQDRATIYYRYPNGTEAWQALTDHDPIVVVMLEEDK
jgi:hypothetical protein